MVWDIQKASKEELRLCLGRFGVGRWRYVGVGGRAWSYTQRQEVEWTNLSLRDWREGLRTGGNPHLGSAREFSTKLQSDISCNWPWCSKLCSAGSWVVPINWNPPCCACSSVLSTRSDICVPLQEVSAAMIPPNSYLSALSHTLEIQTHLLIVPFASHLNRSVTISNQAL